MMTQKPGIEFKGILFGSLFGALAWILIIFAIIGVQAAWATETHESEPSPSQEQEQHQYQTSISSNVTETSVSTEVSTDNNQLVQIQQPRTRLLIGSGSVSSAGYSTAPCTVTKRSWSVGVGVGGKSAVDAECWAEYLVEAEHQRAMDLRHQSRADRLVAVEEGKLALERERFSTCSTCDLSK